MITCKSFVIGWLLLISSWMFGHANAISTAETHPYERGFYLGFRAGGSKLSDESDYFRISGTLNHFAFKLGYDINKYLAIQANLGASVAEVGDFTASLFDVDIKISPLYGQVRPYIVAGVGTYQPKLFGGTLTGETQGAANIGTGLSVNLSRRNSLGIEVIYHRIAENRLTGDNVFGSTTVAIDYLFTF